MTRVSTARPVSRRIKFPPLGFSGLSALQRRAPLFGYSKLEVRAISASPPRVPRSSGPLRRWSHGQKSGAPDLVADLSKRR
jgi:hypothetical protein